MSIIATEDYQKILSQLPIVCVDVLIIYEGKCLLLLRDNEPAKNTYWFPGGRIYKNELIHEAAVRKAKEETNLDCKFIRIISAEESFFEKVDHMTTDIHTINICCLIEVENIKNLKLDYLHTGMIWIDEIDQNLHNAVTHPLLLLGFKFQR